MNISVSEAAQRLAELVRRAEAGEEIVLTDAGKAVARLKAEEKRPLTPEEKLAIIDDISRRAAKEATPGPDAAHSQDFLYDPETGLPA